MLNFFKKIWKWILILLLIAFFIFLAEDSSAATGVWVDVSENYKIARIQDPKDDNNYYYLIQGMCSNDEIDYSKGYFVVFYDKWALNEKIDVDIEATVTRFFGTILLFQTNKSIKAENLNFRAPTDYSFYRVYKLNKSGYLTTCWYHGPSEIEEEISKSKITPKVYYFTGDIFDETESIYNPYDFVNNPTFDDNIYSDYITKSSDLRSDLTLLNVPFGDFYYETKDLDNQIITFSLAYNDDLSGYNLVCYLYSKKKLNKGDFIYFKPGYEGENKTTTRLGLEKWEVISSYKNLYKLDFKVSSGMSLNTIVKSFGKVQFYISKVYYGLNENLNIQIISTLLSTFSDKVLVEMDQHFQILNEETKANKRNSSCVGYNEEQTLVEALTYGYVFDAQYNGFWSGIAGGPDVNFMVYITYFNVYEDGKKWEDIQIKNINYTYTETVVNNFYYDNAWAKFNHNTSLFSTYEYLDFDGNRYKGTSSEDNSYLIKASVDASEHVNFRYPENTSKNYWTNYDKDDAKIELYNVWKLGDKDSEFSKNLKFAETYDPSVHEGYTYGMVLGNSPYTYVMDNQICLTHLCSYKFEALYDVKLKDFLDITYIKQGIRYCVVVDETHAEFGGYLEGGKAPVQITYIKGSSFFDILKKAFKTIGNAFESVVDGLVWTWQHLGTIVMLLIFGIIIYLIIKVINFFRTIRRERKAKHGKDD